MICVALTIFSFVALGAACSNPTSTSTLTYRPVLTITSSKSLAIASAYPLTRNEPQALGAAPSSLGTSAPAFVKPPHDAASISSGLSRSSTGSGFLASISSGLLPSGYYGAANVTSFNASMSTPSGPAVTGFEGFGARFAPNRGLHRVMLLMMWII